MSAGRFKGPVGAGPDELDDSLRLAQVELAVKEGPTGEFARFGEAARACRVWERISSGATRIDLHPRRVRLVATSITILAFRECKGLCTGSEGMSEGMPAKRRAVPRAPVS